MDKLKELFLRNKQDSRRKIVETYVSAQKTGALAVIVDDVIDNFSSVYAGDPAQLDPQRLAYEAGVRAAIQYILRQVEITPHELLYLRKKENTPNVRD
jgi:hypothetical protein